MATTIECPHCGSKYYECYEIAGECTTRMILLCQCEKCEGYFSVAYEKVETIKE